MLNRVWSLLRETVEGYIEDEAMSRGAAIAYYTIFSVAPLLVIATAIAGLAFGEQAVQGAIADQLRGLLGPTGAEAVQGLVASADRPGVGTFAAVVSVATLLVIASGVFSELQSALNAIWRAEPPKLGTVTAFLRAKALSIGLVATTGFLLLASLVISALISAVSTWASGRLPAWTTVLSVVNFTVSLLILTGLFAAIYKILPDRYLSWRDVGVGAFATALLFTIGKSLIGWYIGSSAVASAYGAAGALMVVLLWVYYSAQIFLLGAEFTRAWAGLRANAPVVPPEPVTRGGRRRVREERRGLDPVGVLGSAAIGAALMAVFRRRRG